MKRLWLARLWLAFWGYLGRYWYEGDHRRAEIEDAAFDDDMDDVWEPNGFRGL